MSPYEQAWQSEKQSETHDMQLLVSVRDAAEAHDAAEGGAAIIDVKEPAHGALGAAHPDCWRDVIHAVAGRAPVSVALGELRQLRSELMDNLDPEIRYAKIGLAGCQQLPDWVDRWTSMVRRLQYAAPVAVVYADWRTSQSPPPHEVLSAARQLRCPALLCDTCDKQRGTLFDHLDADTLLALRHQTRQHGMALVMAGSLGLPHVPSLLRFQPDYMAVRGAACVGNRLGKIEREKVRQLVRQLSPASCP